MFPTILYLNFDSPFKDKFKDIGQIMFITLCIQAIIRVEQIFTGKHKGPVIYIYRPFPVVVFYVSIIRYRPLLHVVAN